MTDDELLARIEQKVAASETRFPRATLAAVRDAEARLGFALPSLYVRLLTEVANGGFGPEDGIMGLPPDGFTDRDVQGSVVDAYFEGRAVENPKYREPVGAIFLVSLGGAEFLQLDCLDPNARVLLGTAGAERPLYFLAWPGLREFLEKWLDDVDLQADLYEVVGYRDGKNPFTGQPHRFEVTRVRRGPVELADRI